MDYYKYNKGGLNSKTEKSHALGPTRFNRPRDTSKTFNITRPAFKSGTITISEPPLDIDTENRRTGTNDIVRNNFIKL